MKNISLILVFFATTACASPAPVVTMTPPPTRTATYTPAPTATSTPVPLSKVEQILVVTPLVTKFTTDVNKWPVLPADTTPAEMNAYVASHEVIKDDPNKISVAGFTKTVITGKPGEAFEILEPLMMKDGKLVPLSITKIDELPVISTHGFFMKDYFALNFPDMVAKWEGKGSINMKDAAGYTQTLKTDFGPLRLALKTTNKFFVESNKYPLKTQDVEACLFDPTKDFPEAKGMFSNSFYATPIVGDKVEGKGALRIDSLGWVAMVDVLQAEREQMKTISDALTKIVIDSPEALAKAQAEFDKMFFAVECNEAPFTIKQGVGA